jgi:replicative DNA helicase
MNDTRLGSMRDSAHCEETFLMRTKKHKIPGVHIRDISTRYGKGKPTKFYPTGIKELDAFTGGIPSGEMTVIAARPGVGKTALAMQFVEHVGMYTKDPCGFFSFEMSGRSLVTRMILSRTGLPSVALRKGELTQKQIVLRDEALEDIGELPVYIDDSSIATIPHIEKTAGQWIKAGIKFLALDYVQLMFPSKGGAAGGGDTRANFVGECARALKEIAKRNDVPFLVLSQLNRESEKGKSPPTAANLKDSGDLEQVADNILLIHPDLEAPPHCDFLLVKWRNGPVGTVSVHFDSSRTKFSSIDKDD